MIRCLVADDEQHKVDKLCEFLAREFSMATVEVSRSVKSTMRALAGSEFSVVLLDMSLPTFDVGPGEGGGRPQGFGGVEVLRFLAHRKIVVPVIIVTQYEAFPNDNTVVDLAQLIRRLQEQHPERPIEGVYFAPLSQSWHSPLRNAVERAISGNRA